MEKPEEKPDRYAENGLDQCILEEGQPSSLFFTLVFLSKLEPYHISGFESQLFHQVI